MNDFFSKKGDNTGSEASELSSTPEIRLHEESNGGEFLDDGIRMAEQPFKSRYESDGLRWLL